MTERFIDTDVIIRLVTGDDPVKQAAAARLFDAVEAGEVELVAPDTVIADAVYVLSGRLYSLGRREIKEMLDSLLSIPGFKVQHRTTVQDALELYASTSLDFSDCYIAANIRRSRTKTLYSYDRDFDRIDGVTRIEPA